MAENDENVEPSKPSGPGSRRKATALRNPKGGSVTHVYDADLAASMRKRGWKAA